MQLGQTVVTIVLFFLILGSLVVIHELGHFITARLAGVRVLEFGIGFPPRAKVLRSSGETLYTLNWLPIGGFVKLEGEDGDEADDPRSFVNARLPVKLVILVAGVAMNLVLSFVIFAGIAFVGDPTLGIRVGEIQPGSPAAQAGLRSGDVVASVDGEYYSAFGQRSVLVALQEKAGTTVRLGIERTDGTKTEVPVTLRDRAAVFAPADPSVDCLSSGRGALGVCGLAGRSTSVSIGHGPLEAVSLGTDRTVSAFRLIIDGLGQLADSIRTNPTAPPPAAGPVGIASQIGDVFWQLGPIVTLYMAGVLSANLAVVNILPFPPLDGGRMLVLVLKALFGRRISVQAERLTYLVGFVFLFAFLIWITGFDLIRQFGGGQ
jgi:regulator of sigma E protease